MGFPRAGIVGDAVQEVFADSVRRFLVGAQYGDRAPHGLVIPVGGDRFAVEIAAAADAPAHGAAVAMLGDSRGYEPQIVVRHQVGFALYALRGVAQGGVDRLRAERHVTAVLRSVFVGGQDAVRAGRNEQERTLDLAGSPLFEPVDDEVGVEHVAGCQVAVGAPVVGACRIVAGKHLASVGADAHLGRRVAVGSCERITREDEAVAVFDVGQAEGAGVCGAQSQAFAQERSVGEILSVERHPEPSEPLLPRERIGDDGSAVGEFLLRGRGVVPKRHVGTDRAAVHGEFEERFAR